MLQLLAVALSALLLSAHVARADYYIDDGAGDYCAYHDAPSAKHPRCSQQQIAAFEAANIADLYARIEGADTFTRVIAGRGIGSCLQQDTLRCAKWFLGQVRQAGCDPAADGCKVTYNAVAGCEPTHAMFLEETVMAAIVCERAGTRTLYEVLSASFAPGDRARVRVATAEQVDADFRSMSAGAGLAGDWWK